MRWKGVVVLMGLLSLACISCTRTCFMTPTDLNYAQDLGLPPHLECDPSASIVPAKDSTPSPATVEDTNRQIRYLSLREAIAIALERGTVGSQSPTAAGFASDALSGFTGAGVSGADAIRVLALDPAIVQTNIESALSRFDVQWNTSLTWTKTEAPVSGISLFGTPGVGTGGTGGTGGTTPGTGGGGSFLNGAEALNTQAAAFSTGLIKPLPTGGTAGITFTTNYTHNNNPNQLNPQYMPQLQFTFEQPLLQGFGEEINQLRTTHPGSILTPFNAAGQAQGILIARLRFDQQEIEFQRNIHFMLLNVETAYWNLWNAYYQLYTREEGMRQAFGVWQINQQRYAAGRLAEQDVAQFRLQYETFRGQRLTALGQILETERQLRGLLGLPIEDGTRLVPTDQPMLAPYHPDWCTSLDQALANRPELILARQDLKFRQLDLIRAKNDLLPDLRFTASDTLHSLGSQIDEGPVPQNAFHDLASDPFNDVSLGLRMTMPLGFRGAHAEVRGAQLELARSFRSLRTEEEKAERFLGLTYRQLFEFYRQIQIQRTALEAARIEVTRDYQEYQAGRGDPVALLLAQRDYTTTLSSLYAAYLQYVNNLAIFSFATGDILRHDNVVISDGPLPGCVQVRAVEHERERTNALVLAEREPGAGPPIHTDPYNAGLPPVTSGSLPPLPTLFPGKPVPDFPTAVDNGGKQVSRGQSAGSPDRPAESARTPESPAESAGERPGLWQRVTGNKPGVARLLFQEEPDSPPQVLVIPSGQSPYQP
ncbi:MAG: TolC family protein [Planctomycetes bacterium]|nr:TolC family protein [Planctomycetota bacterium]